MVCTIISRTQRKMPFSAQEADGVDPREDVGVAQFVLERTTQCARKVRLHKVLVPQRLRRRNPLPPPPHASQRTPCTHLRSRPIENAHSSKVEEGGEGDGGEEEEGEGEGGEDGGTL